MNKQAQLYRMVTDEHICPFGLKAKDLLEREGFTVEDYKLSSREQTDEFKEKYQVDTTPQVFIDGKPIGGYDALRNHLGKQPEGTQGTMYRPVLAIFAVAALLALVMHIFSIENSSFKSVIMTFIGFSMVLLAVPKLQDITVFSNRFITYDLLALRQLRYAKVYPYAELYAGLGMLAGLWAWLVAPVAIFIGSIGCVSVIKAVYIDKRDLKCACVGGDANVPLGLLTLTENTLMLIAGVWMLI